MADELIDIANLLKDIKFDQEVYLVECASGFSLLNKSSFSHIRELLAQFAGGLKVKDIVYLGTDAKKAELIFNSLNTTHNHIQEIINAVS